MEKKTKKKIIIGLGAAATGVLGFFGWQWWRDTKGSKNQQSQLPDTNNNSRLPGSNTSTNRSLPSGGSNEFPLRKGSRGAKVKALQQALINKYGSSILPRYGADGDYGNEVAAALKKEGLPSTIDEATYNSIVGGSNTSSDNSNSSSGISDPGKVASDLNDAVNNSDLSKAISALQEMKSVADYKAVDEVFKKNYTFGFVSKTIVNAMLDAFTNEGDKIKIRMEFSRIGLRYDGKQWHLSGIESFTIITTEPTEVFDKEGEAIEVSAGTVLGNAVGQKGEWMYFIPSNAQVILRVKKQTIKQFNKQ